jgi:hypothetical protein
MRKMLVGLVMLLAGTVGCGHAPAQRPAGEVKQDFRDDGEELAYLSSLANPTLDQWRRREELRRKREDEDRRAERDREQQREQARFTYRMAHARELEKVAPSAAVTYYREVVDQVPNSPEGREAAEAIKRLEAAGYGARPKGN